MSSVVQFRIRSVTAAASLALALTGLGAVAVPASAAKSGTPLYPADSKVAARLLTVKQAWAAAATDQSARTSLASQSRSERPSTRRFKTAAFATQDWNEQQSTRKLDVFTYGTFRLGYPTNVGLFNEGTVNAARHDLGFFPSVVKSKRYASDLKDSSWGKDGKIWTYSVTLHGKKYKAAAGVTRYQSVLAVGECTWPGSGKAIQSRLVACAKRVAIAQRDKAKSLFSHAPLTATMPTIHSKVTWDMVSTGCVKLPCTSVLPVENWRGWDTIMAPKGSALQVKFTGGTKILFTLTKIPTKVTTYTVTYGTRYYYSPSKTFTLVVTPPTLIATTADPNPEWTPYVAASNYPGQCFAAAPSNPGTLTWCSKILVPSNDGTATYDGVEAVSVDGKGIVGTRFFNNQWQILYQPKSNGAFTDTVKFRLTNSKLGLKSGYFLIHCTVDHNSNF